MIETLKNAFKNKEIRHKILMTLLLLFIYRLGCWIPVPGIELSALANAVGDNTLFGLLSAIGGNALTNGALLAIGISPYINASIIVQLLSVAIPPLERLTKQGEEGRKKIAIVTRYVTLALAVMQAAGIAISWYNSNAIMPIFGANSTAWIAVFVAAMMVGGSMFTMWLGEKITDYGVGNGMSLLIFVGVLSSAGLALFSQISSIVNYYTSGESAQGDMKVWELAGFLVMVLIVFFFIVWVDLAERRIPVNYAKQVKGRKQYGGQSTHIPIKVNANGVLPIIFATAIITFPQVIFQLIFSGSTNTESAGWKFYEWWSRWLGAGTPLYFVLMGILILFFSYFYAKIQFNPEDVARNLQQYGGTITGIRPGKPTADYLGKVNSRLTLFGAIFLVIIAIVPSIVFSLVMKDATLVNAFTATGMLIVVSVALEFNKQLEGLLMMKHYKGFLK